MKGIRFASPLTFHRDRSARFGHAYRREMHSHITGSCPIQEIYCLKPFVMSRRGIRMNPVSLHEDMAHSSARGA
jgi:hypothetical protein